MACKVLVVCGSPVVASADLLRRLAGECDHVVAVDRGLDALLGAGLLLGVGFANFQSVGQAVSLSLVSRSRYAQATTTFYIFFDLLHTNDIYPLVMVQS